MNVSASLGHAMGRFPGYYVKYVAFMRHGSRWQDSSPTRPVWTWATIRAGCGRCRCVYRPLKSTNHSSRLLGTLPHTPGCRCRCRCRCRCCCRCYRCRCCHAVYACHLPVRWPVKGAAPSGNVSNDLCVAASKHGLVDARPPTLDRSCYEETGQIGGGWQSDTWERAHVLLGGWMEQAQGLG